MSICDLAHISIFHKQHNIDIIDAINEEHMIHRIDKSVSGLVLYSQCTMCIKQAKKMIKNRQVIKIYRALLYGKLMHTKRVCNYVYFNVSTMKLQISKYSNNKFNRLSTTTFIPIKYVYINDIILTEALVYIVTGRTNQIRAHALHINHAIINDYKYGMNNSNYISASNKYEYTQLHCMTYCFINENLEYTCFNA